MLIAARVYNFINFREQMPNACNIVVSENNLKVKVCHVCVVSSSSVVNGLVAKILSIDVGSVKEG